MIVSGAFGEMILGSVLSDIREALGMVAGREGASTGEPQTISHKLFIERVVPYSPKEVWGALICQCELGVQGAMMHFVSASGVSAGAGRVTVYDSRRTLECSWNGCVLRWDLRECDRGTLLVFMQMWVDGCSMRTELGVLRNLVEVV